MAETSQFYRDRADQAAREAEASPLANVRDRCRRSEAAWRLMAERLEKSENARKQAVAEREAVRAAEVQPL